MPDSVEKRLKAIEARNKRVEVDKAWETSWARKGAILVLTYIVAATYMWRIGVTDYFLSAFIPMIGYFLSTLGLHYLRNYWEKHR